MNNQTEKNQNIQFRKIIAKSKDIDHVKNRFSKTLDEFYDYRELLSSGSGFKNTGSKGSYPLYLARLVVLYEENFEELIDDLNDVDSYNKLNLLRNSPKFKEYNEQEGRFPNAALNGYKDFLMSKLYKEEQQIDAIFNEKLLSKSISTPLNLITGPTQKRITINRYRHSCGRNLDESQQAKITANWTCEYNEKHKTFVSGVNNRPYVEAHHLIPMSAQIDFENTIDFADNIISLCPTCHRNIHYGKNEEKEKMLKYFFEIRKPLYSIYGIAITMSDLNKYYHI